MCVVDVGNDGVGDGVCVGDVRFGGDDVRVDADGK